MPAPRLFRPKFFGPPAFYAVRQSLFGQAQALRQNRKSDFLPLVENECSFRVVVLLLLRASPAAVFCAIRTAVAFAIYRGAFGPLTHIPQEGGKIRPRRINSYSACAITRVFGMLGVGAPLDHSRPRIISSRLAGFCGMPMLRASRAVSAGLGAILTPASVKAALRGVKTSSAFSAANNHRFDLLAHGARIVQNKIARNKKAGGRVMAGLTRRRAAEANLYRGLA